MTPDQELIIEEAAVLLNADSHTRRHLSEMAGHYLDRYRTARAIVERVLLERQEVVN